MTKDCNLCENDSLMRLAELEIENERLRDWRYRLEQALEQSHEMIKALREENEEQANKLRIYQEHCLNSKNEPAIQPEEEKEEIPQKTIKEEVDNILDDLIRTLGKMEFKP